MVWQLNYPRFRHLDFNQLETAADCRNTIVVCRGCGVFYRVLDIRQHQALFMVYQSPEYAEHQEAHMVRIGTEMRCVHEVQVDRIFSQWPQAAAARAILDIGCFDGKLLASWAARGSASRLVGYDVAPRYGLPSRDGFEFHFGDRAALPGGFDLILLSQSMMYIQDVNELFGEFAELLNPDGCIFVHVPNVSLRPCTLLLADQIFYFTPYSLQTLFARHGFVVEFISHETLLRDVLLLARRGTAPPVSNTTPVSNALPDIEAVLMQINVMVDSFCRISGDGLSVFGTTIEAAFAHSFLGEKVKLFVDENRNKIGRRFNGKPVVAPGSLPASSTCIVPMGSAAEDISNRLSAQYPCRFIAV